MIYQIPDSSKFLEPIEFDKLDRNELNALSDLLIETIDQQDITVVINGELLIHAQPNILTFYEKVTDTSEYWSLLNQELINRYQPHVVDAILARLESLEIIL